MPMLRSTLASIKPANSPNGGAETPSARTSTHNVALSSKMIASSSKVMRHSRPWLRTSRLSAPVSNETDLATIAKRCPGICTARCGLPASLGVTTAMIRLAATNTRHAVITTGVACPWTITTVNATPTDSAYARKYPDKSSTRLASTSGFANPRRTNEATTAKAPLIPEDGRA